ncbi:MAG: hypothetical protein K9K67_12425 [Bacteriovoracaceae bacterium]|nr:hypothetical protein [Bacteriovoracaceae bacterium]
MRPDRYEELEQFIQSYTEHPQDEGWESSLWCEVFHYDAQKIINNFLVVDYNDLVSKWSERPLWWKKHCIMLLEPSTLNLPVFNDSLRSEDDILAFLALRQMSFWYESTQRTLSKLKELRVENVMETISSTSSEQFRQEFKPLIESLKKMD